MLWTRIYGANRKQSWTAKPNFCLLSTYWSSYCPNFKTNIFCIYTSRQLWINGTILRIILEHLSNLVVEFTSRFSILKLMKFPPWISQPFLSKCAMREVWQWIAIWLKSYYTCKMMTSWNQSMHPKTSWCGWICRPVLRHVARNFDRGANNNEVSTFKYIMPLVFKASSTKCAFFWCFCSE